MIIFHNTCIFIIGIHKDTKSSQDIASDKSSVNGNEEVLTAVRFAKKVVIESSLSGSQSQEPVTIETSAQIVYDKESMSTTAENSTNEISASCEQPGKTNLTYANFHSFCFYLVLFFNLFSCKTAAIPEERVANIHQDDDGFESLNGNVSSDNDRVMGRAIVQRNRSRENVANQPKNHNRTSWLENDASQQVRLPTKHSGLTYKYTLVTYNWPTILQN